MQPVKLTDAEKTRRLAEGCMGWKYSRADKHHHAAWNTTDGGYLRVDVWQPLHNEAHAAEVREAMRAKGYNCLQMQSVSGVNMCDFFVDATTSLRPEHSSETSAIAICHAALLALGLAKEEEL